MDESEDMTNDSGLEVHQCTVQDATGHTFEVHPVCRAQFTKGNADCERVTRFLVVCISCGKSAWIEDPEAPVL